MTKQRLSLNLSAVPLIAILTALLVSFSVNASAAPTTVFLNQWGFLPQQEKIAVVADHSAHPFTVTELKSNRTVMEGETSAPEDCPEAGMAFSQADISGITTPGEYRLSIEGAEPAIFAVRTNPFSDIHDAAVKTYYYARASTALDPAFAGKWHRGAGHADDEVAKLGAPDEPAAKRSKGWYDAGDYNKYVVNSGTTTYTLLRAYLDHPEFYAKRHWNIPESMNTRADLLDEVLWNIDWLVTMQDEDGGVYHKLTTLDFAAPVMPAAATAKRYTTSKSTAATLNFAAVMAVAARVFDTRRDTFLNRAARALEWAKANPQRYYRNEGNVTTGEYGDDELVDEHNWAAIEYAITTNDISQLSMLTQQLAPVTTPSWANVTGLSYLSVLQDAAELLPAKENARLKSALLRYADEQLATMTHHPLEVPIVIDDFVWGSNAVLMNKAMMMEVAWDIAGKPAYRDASLALIDYISGRNPTGFSFVTGFGHRTPRFIHHRPSEADNVADPVPGWLVGGPQNGHQDKCSYPTDLPATSYLDDWCSYSTNEVAINWNAPLVYVLGSIVANPK